MNAAECYIANGWVWSKANNKPLGKLVPAPKVWRPLRRVHSMVDGGS